jgi:transglutaminase-like putative cysteine protease
MKKFSLLFSLMLFANFSYAQESNTIQLDQKFSPTVTGEKAELWIPIPMQIKNYQDVISQTHTGNADSVKIENVGSVQMMHVVWKKADKPEFQLVTKLKLQNEKAPLEDIKNQKQFLKPSVHVQTDGIVLQTANEITDKITDPDLKALAIYNWIIDKTVRDPKVRGCGLGDVKSTLTVGNFSGKCADLNSLFVGLARAAKIPAREVFGLRVNVSKEFSSLGKLGEVSKAQHCRAEYYSVTKKSWIPVDPADVRKAILEEKLAANDPKIKALQTKFFGSWEGNWIAFNHGRDFVIPTKNKKIEINYFMYPLLVSKSLSPDGMDPKEVSYSFESKVL